METDSSNRSLLERWRQGDEFAAQILVDRYLVRLTALAKARLSRKLSRRLDPEDIVLSAWRSFFVATRGGRIAVPPDDDLWPLLLTMTLRKLRRQVARQTAEKRAIDDEQELDSDAMWMQAVARDPTPEDAAVVTDQLERLLANLSFTDREIVVHRLQGLTNTEIGQKLGIAERTVRRAFVRIREHARVVFPVNEDRPAQSGTDEPRGPTPAKLERVHEGLDLPIIDDDGFLLQQFVGGGGFGKVYRAIFRQTQQTVAVKFLSKRFWHHPAALEGFRSEIEILAMLNHPNIVAIHGWGRTSAEAPYFVMEYVEGPNLTAWARAHSSAIDEVLRLMIQVVDAVATAHTLGVIHGDLAPSNVLIEQQTGRIVLTDFGFSRMTQQQRLTMLGGTPGFLAPEQMSDSFGEVTTRTDVYGLGGILYWLCTAQPPFVGDSIAEVTANVLSSRPPIAPQQLNPRVPTALSSFVLECLAKEPADRPESVKAIVERLSKMAELP